MATITDIKSRILQLDSATFQILCDAYLSREGYENIVSLGTMAGASKTTRGTPDTYFIDENGHYVFCEYTTQQDNILKKINSDIDKCLDFKETNIPLELIDKIIYCHTSSNLKPSDDLELKKKCSDSGIDLVLIGIDKLAEDLLSRYLYIVKDHLGLSIDTEQILSLDDFIEIKKYNNFSAPLDTLMVSREKELSEIKNILDQNDVLIITGAAGVGKTRIAIEAARKLFVGKYKIYVIHNRGLELYEDLKIYLSNSGNYFFIIDDANEIDRIKYILEYVNKKDLRYNVKAILTVRNYAVNGLIENINSCVNFKTFVLEQLNNKSITELVKKTYNINNFKYLDQIESISNGNARLAMIAGEVAMKKGTLSSITDATSLYDAFYGSNFGNIKIDKEKDLLKALGILAFLGPIRIDDLTALLPFFRKSGITEEIFKSCVTELEQDEIVDVIYDKVVKIPDQCYANYILKHVFCDKKTLCLSDFIEMSFLKHRQKMIDSLNVLLCIFRNKKLYDFVKSEVNTVWKKLKREDKSLYEEFAKVCHDFNELETLSIIKGKIDSQESTQVDIVEIDKDVNGRRNQNSINDETLPILCDMVYGKNIDMVFDLYFEYFLKRPDLYFDFYHAAIRYFNVCNNSIDRNYEIHYKFIQKLIQISDDWKNEYVKHLFIDIAAEFLSFEFKEYSTVKNMSLRIYNIHVSPTEGVLKYRNLIWKQILTIAQNRDYDFLIKKYWKNMQIICWALLMRTIGSA